MATELQSLLDKIQNEGVAKADAKAERILIEAKERAAGIVAEAEKKRAAVLTEAEQSAKLFQERAEQSIRQAARDVMLGVREALQQTLDRLFLEKITESLSTDVIKDLVVDAVRAYISEDAVESGVSVQVSPLQAEELRTALLAEARELAEKGLEVRADREVRAGFRVTLAQGRVEHDFSAGAIQDALATLLRPALAELLTAEG